MRETASSVLLIVGVMWPKVKGNMINGLSGLNRGTGRTEKEANK